MTKKTKDVYDSDDIDSSEWTLDYVEEDYAWSTHFQMGGQKLLTITQDGAWILHMGDQDIELDPAKVTALLATCAKD